MSEDNVEGLSDLQDVAPCHSIEANQTGRFEGSPISSKPP
jgi:hypothetical protein